jgi:hypothetical protein
MSTTYNWVINQLQCRPHVDGFQDVINIIHWTYNATDVDDSGKEWFASVYGSVGVEQPNPQNFTPYPDVTEEQVISWLEQVLPVNQMQLGLASNIELQKHPVEITLPLPWSPTTTTTTTEAPIETTTTISLI